MTEENGTTPEQQPVTICRTCKNVVLNGTQDGECDSCHVHRVLNVQDDERKPTTPSQQQPQPGHVAISVNSQGMTLQITPQPIALLIAEDGMQQMVKEWLASHPELFDELIKQRLTQRKTELAIIRDIQSSKLN